MSAPATPETTSTVYWSEKAGNPGAWLLTIKRGHKVRTIRLTARHPRDRDAAEAEAALVTNPSPSTTRPGGTR